MSDAYVTRFVAPDVHTINISRGDVLIVKKRLNSGEQRAAFARMSTLDEKGERKIDRLQVGMSLTIAYLIDWTLRDAAGNVVPIRGKSPEEAESILNALDPESFDEIKDAIDAYDTSLRVAREKEKNGQGGENESPAISPSPGDSAGDTSGLTS